MKSPTPSYKPRKYPRSLLASMTLVYAFLYIPILILVIYSFNESRLAFVWGGFSLKWYKSLFMNDSILHGLWASFKVAFMSASLSIILGTLAVIATLRAKKFRGQKFLDTMIVAPLLVPDLVLGLSFLLLFIFLASFSPFMTHGIPALTIAHTTLSTAYVAIVLRTRLMSLDDTIRQAALDLGATPLTVFFKITLPLIRPALISGWLLAFSLSLDDVVIASFLAGPGSTTLPLVVFSSLRLGVTPEINALATIIVSLVGIGVTMGGIFINRRLKDDYDH